MKEIWLVPLQILPEVPARKSFSHFGTVWRLFSVNIEQRAWKNPTTLLIMWGGHRQHPTPTAVIVSSNYKLSGKLF